MPRRTTAAAVLLLVATVALAGATAPTAASALASSFEVNTTVDTHDALLADQVCADDTGACSLRAALEQANAVSDADTVTVRAGTYTLTIAAALPLSNSVTVSGAGPGATVVDAGGDTGVMVISSGTVMLSGLTLTGGGGTSGSGLQVEDGVVTAHRIAVRDNTVLASGASGAGIHNFEGELTLSHSSVTGNLAKAAGSDAFAGGVFVGAAASLVVRRTTIADNSAEATAPGTSSFGGGVFSYGTTLLEHVTLSGNRATAASGGQGGNLYTYNASPAVALRDSIVSGGTATLGPNCFGKPPQPLGKSLDSGTSCGFGAGQLSATDPQLGPLADGTQVPVAGSPAVDAAAACGADPTDQRGQPLPVGPACDIGAVELGADLSTSFSRAPKKAKAGGAATYVVSVSNSGYDASTSSLKLKLPKGAAVKAIVPARGSCSGLVCNLGAIPRDDAVRVTLVLRLKKVGAAKITARATGSVPEVSAADDAATATTRVISPGTPVLRRVRLTGTLHTGKAGKLAFRLSKAARVQVKVARLVERNGTTKAVPLGTLTASARAGDGTLTIPGKIGGRTIAPGTLRLTATAVDTAGRRSEPVRLEVQVRP